MPRGSVPTGLSDVARLVRLHHRRRGWAWVATGSTIGLVVYAGISLHRSGNLTAAAEALRVIPVIALLALALAGLVVVIVDTARIHRADAADRVSAKGGVSHYPVYAHAHRYPPRHHGSWVAAIGMLAAMTAIAAFFLPAQVNSWAFMLGAEHQDTFHPMSYAQSCSGMTRRGGGCTTVTEGYLSRSGQAATWGTQVALGQPFSARDPVWAWGTGRTLISGDSSAIPTILADLFFDALALLLLYVLFALMRHTPPPSRRSPVPAGAGPGGVRLAHHPNRSRPGSGASRRARRSGGKR